MVGAVLKILRNSGKHLFPASVLCMDKVRDVDLREREVSELMNLLKRTHRRRRERSNDEICRNEPMAETRNVELEETKPRRRRGRRRICRNEATAITGDLNSGGTKPRVDMDIRFVETNPPWRRSYVESAETNPRRRRAGSILTKRTHRPANRTIKSVETNPPSSQNQA